MRLTFVGSRQGNAFMNELLAALAHEVGLLDMDVYLAFDSFPEMDGRAAYVVIPHEYFATVPAKSQPSSKKLARTIAFCVEQPGTPWFDLAAAHASRVGAALDISRGGTRELRRRGVRAEHVRLGYTEQWDRWHGDESFERPVDVLHLGTDTWRRRKALAGYASTLWPHETRILVPPVAPKTEARPDFLLGESKWEALRSAKTLLNLHRQASPFFEWLRVLEAIANGCVVVSEHSLDTDPLLPGEDFVSGTAENLGPLADRLLQDEDGLRKMRHSAYELVRAELTMRPLAEILADLAEQLASRASRRAARARSRVRAAAKNVAEPSSEEAPDPDAAATKRHLLAEIDEARRKARELCRRRGVDPDVVEEVTRTLAYDAVDPRVSVLVPLYNHADEVTVAIGSAADSTYGKLELVVLDDGSTDDSSAAVERALAERPWLPAILFRHRVNQGLGPTRNHLVERSRGEYVFALDADNEIYPTALERLVAVLDEHPTAMFAYSTLEEHEDGVPTSLRSYQPWEPERLRDGNYVDAMSLMRRDALVEIGGYTDDLRLYGWEDYDLWCRAAERGLEGVHLPQILGRYHHGATSMISLTALDHGEAKAVLRKRYPRVMGAQTPRDPSDRGATTPGVSGREGHYAVRALPGETVLPPVHLASRVGATHADNLALYEEFGAETREEILGLLPQGWSFEGKTVLDFGCGAGRTLRHFLGETAVARVLGCDIHDESVAWLGQHLSPPLEVFRSPEVPPLPLSDGSVDLIWAISVFTHLTDHAGAWLLELHRVLRTDGLLIATFHGCGAIRSILDEDWDPDRIGMTIVRYGESWDAGGPMVVHSPWWIREHWGRLFEIATLREEGFAVRTTRDRKPPSWGGQGVVVMRRKPVRVTVGELERIDPRQPLEVAALLHNLELVHRESYASRRERDLLQAQLAALGGAKASRPSPSRSASGQRARLGGMLRRAVAGLHLGA
jgi:glycosyltransferase involved in cell wall biosynthesis